MWNFASSLFQKVVHFSPVKIIFQQLFQKVSKDFLETQPEFTFKDGVLLLNKLQLSATKINTTFLVGSPYVISYGAINSIKINLPEKDNKTNSSIEVKISGVELIMEPNKNFKETFEQNLKQMKNQIFVQEESNTSQGSNSFGFFKRMIKQFLTNIKIEIEDISIKWFMNKPSKSIDLKPQFYFMFRVPEIMVYKVDDKGKIHEDFMKYKVQIPQISLHILKQDIKVPQYYQLGGQLSDIPYKYPPVNHPSTILLIGRENKTDKQKISISLRISKDVKAKTKQLSVSVDIPNIEFMIDPKQLIVITKFVEQILTFKSVFNSIVDKVKSQGGPLNKNIQESRDFDVLHEPELVTSPSKNNDLNKSMDIFSSFAFQQFGGVRASKQSTYFNNIFENNKQIQQELGKLQKQIQKQTKIQTKQQPKQDFKDMKSIKISLNTIKLYVLKYQTGTEFYDYERIWSLQETNRSCLINNFIPCSYIMASVNQVQVSIENNTSTIIKIKDICILDVQLKSLIKQPLKPAPVQQKIQQSLKISQSIDIFQSFQNIPVQGLQLKQLIKFQINPTYNHYCSTTILSISHKSSLFPTFQNPTIKHKNFFSILKNNQQHQPNEKQFGITIKIQKLQKQKITLNILSIFLLLDDRFIYESLLVFKPLLVYKSINDSNINIDVQNTAVQQQNFNRKVLGRSIYDFHDQVNFQNNLSLKNKLNSSTNNSHNKKLKPQFNFQVQQIHIIIQSLNNLPADMVNNYKEKTYDNQLFNHEYLWDKTINGFDITIQSLRMKKSCSLKINFNDIYVRKIQTIENKLHIEQIVQIGKQGNKSFPRICIQTMVTDTIVKKQVITVYLPKLGILVTKEAPKKILHLAEGFKSKMQELIQLNKYLTQQINKYNKKNDTLINKLPKTNQAARIINIHIERFGFQFLSYELLVRHVLVKIEESIIISKIFEGVLIKPNQPKLKLQNPWKVNEHAYFTQAQAEDKFKKYGIKSGIDRIVVYIEKSMDFPAQGQLKQKQYFQIIYKSTAPIEISVFIQNNKYKPPDQKVSKAPSFSKALKSEPKSKSKLIDIIVRVPIYVKGIQLRQFKIIKLYFDETKNMFKNSRILNSKSNSRKPSQDFNIPPQTIEQKMVVKAFAEMIHVDIFPYVKLSQQEQICSHTRSMIQIIDLDVVFTEKQSIDCKIKIQKTNIKWKQLSLHFLMFNDCYLELNKQIIPFVEIESHGFKRLLDIRGDFQFAETKSALKGKQVQISANIHQIDVICSSHSIGLVDDHFKHIMGNIKQAMSKLPKQENFKQSKDDDESSESSAQNFDQIQEKLRIIQESKLRDESQFRSQPIQLIQRASSDDVLRMNLKQIQIKKVCIKITDNPDYEFLDYIPRGQNIPLMIQLDEKLEISQDLFVQNHQLNTFKRYRSVNKKQGKVLRITLQNAALFLQKYQNKINPRDLNLSLVVNFKALECTLFILSDQQNFSIIKTIDRFQILVNIQKNQCKIKTAGKRLQLGFTSSLNFIKNDIKSSFEKRKQSIFYQNQQKQIQNNSQNKHSVPIDLMLFIPEMIITLNLKLIGWKFINNQSLSIAPFFFHNVLSKYMEDDNKQFVKKWIKDILTDNLGKLLGNGFTNLVSNGIIALLILIKKIVMLPGKTIQMLIS